VNKRVLIGALVLIVGALALIASGCGGGGGGKKKTGGGGATLPASACGPLYYEGSGDPDYIVASDLPLQGAGRAQTSEMVQAIKFEIKQRDFKAGDYKIGFQSCDDSTAQTGAWDSAKCASNARAYADADNVIGVIGTFNSGCAKIEIPVANRAPDGPLGMVSPANTAIGITHGGPGAEPGEPDKYYPTGKRNYIRVVAADDFQGAADALWAKQLHLKSVYVLNDKQTYGYGVAFAMRKSLLKVGLKVPGFVGWDKNASSYESLVSKINQSGADAVFLGGIICNNGAKLIKDLKAGFNGTILMPDGFSDPKSNGPAAEGAWISVAGAPPEKLKGTEVTASKKRETAAGFLSDFGAQIGARPNPYSAYAAQAMLVMLDAIEKSDGTRASVTDNLFKTKIENGILGTFSIDKNGDTSLNPVTIYQQKGTELKPVKTITPPLSLVKSA
jgi:branched-chain amino acid transport system substrate-binding protein